MSMFNVNGTIDNSNVSEEPTMESTALINEAILMEGLNVDELEELLESAHELNDLIDNEVVMERSVIRLDEKAKLSQAYMASLFTIAREKGDKQFKKLMTVWRIERNIEEYLKKRYGVEATRRAKQLRNTARASKSNLMKKASTKASSQLGNKFKKTHKKISGTSISFNGLSGR